MRNVRYKLGQMSFTLGFQMFKRDRTKATEGGKARGHNPVAPPEPLVAERRQRLLALDPAALRLKPSAMLPRVWGFVMDTGRPAGLLTVAALADGKMALLQGNGWGTELPATALPGSAAMIGALLAVAETQLLRLTPTSTYPLPDLGRVRILVRTFDGDLAGDAPEDDLGFGRHPLSPLFHAAQTLTGTLHEKAKPLSRK